LRGRLFAQAVWVLSDRAKIVDALQHAAYPGRTTGLTKYEPGH
jgi:hypothetical protein